MDEHWALGPLEKIAATSLDALTKSAGTSLSEIREIPPPFFSGSVEEALAGDYLESEAALIATGFFRMGEDTPAYRARTAARMFLGLNLECASCHDHPNEPITTDDYQRLVELFTTPFDDQPRTGTLRPPLHVVADVESQTRLDGWRESLAGFLETPAVDEDEYEAWLENEGNLPKIEGLVAAYAFEKGALTNLAPGSQVTEGGEDLVAEGGALGKGLFFNGNNHLALFGTGIVNELSPFTVSMWVKVAPEALSDTPLVRIGTSERGFELRISNSRLQARWSRAWPENAIAATSEIPIVVPYRWAHLMVTSDGSRRTEGLQLYLNGRSIDRILSDSRLVKSVLVAEQPITFQGTGVSLDELQIYDRALTEIEAAQLFDGVSLGEAFARKDDLRGFFNDRDAGSGVLRRENIAILNRKILEVENPLPEFRVMRPFMGELSEVREDATPVFATGNRLKFARALDHELLARALANEVWREHFGTPLASGFGFADAMPAHPELLEWLAGKLVEFDNDANELSRLIEESTLWQREWPTNPETGPVCPRVE